MSKVSYDLKKQPLQDRAKYTVGVIKEAAAHILREQGLQGFTTNKVAERAGVSIGSLYQYFPSKESLIAEIKRDPITLGRVAASGCKDGRDETAKRHNSDLQDDLSQYASVIRC